MTLLVALALCLQDKTAEETFKKIEETIEKAKTVSIKFKWEGTEKSGEKEEKGQAKGMVMAKEGNKAYINIKMLMRSREMELKAISDGAKMSTASTAFGDKAQERETPKNLKRSLDTALARVGIVQVFIFGMRVTTGDEKGKDEEPDLKKMFEVSDIKSGGDEKEAKTLTYKIKVADQGVTLDAKIWYDPKTFKLFKRSIVGERGTESGTLTETYDEFVLNADIPDEKFKLPAEK